MTNRFPLSCYEIEEALKAAAAIGQLLLNDIHPTTFQAAPRKAEQVALILEILIASAATYESSQMLNREINRRRREQEKDVVVILKGGGSHAS